MAQATRLSPWTHHICWLIILTIHCLVISFCSATAWLYAFLPGTYLDQGFQYIRLGLGTKYHPTMGRVYLIVMVPHGFAVAWMVLGSIWRRRLVFTPNVFFGKHRGWMAKKPLEHLKAANYLKGFFHFCYLHFFCAEGFFGVKNKRFDRVLLVREIIETGIQTYQGYRMSWYLPRSGINGAFVALLILNCWSTALAQLFFHGPANETERRLVCLLCDSLLDLVCSVGIPTTVFLWYWRLYDPIETGIPMNYWYEDVFLVQIVSELQMVVVSSWMDLITRVAFILGVYSSLNNMKKLLRSVSTNKVQDVFVPPAQSIAGPQSQIQTDPTARGGSRTGTLLELKRRATSGRLHGVVFGLWGLVVLVLHLHASSLPVAPNCLLQVRPWGITRPACSLLKTHCYNSGITGAGTELEEVWSSMEPSVVLRLLLLHCPQIEMPPHIQKFTHLTGLKIYNSTVARWDTNAELNSASHQDLTFLHFVRVDFSNGELPMGLQAPVFPPKLFDLEFCITNLASLPADLDKSWHEGSTIYVERSYLDEFPEALVRLKPKHIAVGYNPISSLPPGAFESPNLVYISIASTLVTELPENVTLQSDQLRWIMAPDTNISFWYKWIDPIVGKNNPTAVDAYNSPYCNELQEIRAGNRTAFSVTKSPSPTTKLSQMLMENTTLALQYARCEPDEFDMYNWTHEDVTYGLKWNLITR